MDPAPRLPFRHLLIVLAACAAVYWPFLGVNGFGASEGHRVGPAWEMLQSGDFIHLKLFGQTYLRKPPGMPWAIALSSSLFGQTEFAARAVSAFASTLMALFACWWTTRWLGSPWGLAAGLAQAFAPLYFMTGRTAEIDPLNCLGAQIAALSMVSALSGPPLRRSAAPMMALGLIVAGIAKGPASLPVVLGLVLGACMQSRGPRPLRSRQLWMGLFSGVVILGAFGAWFADVNRDADAVTQDFSEFTWSLARLSGTVLLFPAAFLAACPAAISLVVLLVHRQDRRNRREDATLGVASLLALGWGLAIAVLMLTGSSNPRYAMPAGVLLSPLAGWALRACWLARRDSLAARIVSLGHPAVLGAVMFGLSVGWVVFDLSRGRHREGPVAGQLLADVLPDHAIVWANDLVEARPDILLYARQAASAAGRALTPRWGKSALTRGELPAGVESGGVYLLLRSDEESPEWDRYRGLVSSGALAKVSGGSVGKYMWQLVRVQTKDEHAVQSAPLTDSPPPPDSQKEPVP